MNKLSGSATRTYCNYTAGGYIEKKPRDEWQNAKSRQGVRQYSCCPAGIPPQCWGRAQIHPIQPYFYRTDPSTMPFMPVLNY